jgi:hypothetical protein
MPQTALPLRSAKVGHDEQIKEEMWMEHEDRTGN